ncbi:hypothetical protein GUY44_05005 [Pimelobacter simplex]|uniref:Uncharacterized protein n=1 Tax=Nocardioides simplex TaxID=2045 RepID=A0A0A1DLH7_NOCSI|nr:hypothetical protein [Pimelobacter simplex]AIY17467.1 hypothetical protein KR76_13145 [Pimelobacter simplex]MCG8149828.1 hypothetical protein [Pimelobacter simplex]GEB13963.1 hypothetical protein NSI01_22780 [Pimelobacter simplex]SFM65821.1 hypothetical protein SAMN05421671_2708 [Pimelobacter simplex]
MSGIDPRPPREQRHDRALLGACLAEVDSARAQLQAARRTGARLDAEPFRAHLVAALEEYAATIERSGAPVPRAVRAELGLYRRLGHRL